MRIGVTIVTDTVGEFISKYQNARIASTFDFKLGNLTQKVKKNHRNFRFPGLPLV